MQRATRAMSDEEGKGTFLPSCPPVNPSPFLTVNPYPLVPALILFWRELGQGVVALPSRTWSGNKQPNNQSEQAYRNNGARMPTIIRGKQSIKRMNLVEAGSRMNHLVEAGSRMNLVEAGSSL
jgi:hypothetical protein